MKMDERDKKFLPLWIAIGVVALLIILLMFARKDEQTHESVGHQMMQQPRPYEPGMTLQPGETTEITIALPEPYIVKTAKGTVTLPCNPWDISCENHPYIQAYAKERGTTATCVRLDLIEFLEEYEEELEDKEWPDTSSISDECLADRIAAYERSLQK